MGNLWFSLILVIMGPPAELPLQDLDRFPSQSRTLLALECNYHYRKYAEARRSVRLHEWDAWTEVVGACWTCREPWHELSAAHCGHNSLEARLEALDQLRILLGEWDYAYGLMPCPIPLLADEN